MSKSTKFSREVRECAVRMVLDAKDQYESQWAAIVSIASKIGCTTETLRRWIRQQERNTSLGDGPARTETEQQAADLADQAQRIEREQQAAESAWVELATARLKIEAQDERQSEQAAEIERLRAALAEAQYGRTAAEQQAAVLAAKLEACAERVARAEARVEQIEQQAAKTVQAHDAARAATAQETRQLHAWPGSWKPSP